MSVSTFSFSFWMPCSACTERRRPSKANGRVTTPMVSAPMLLGDLGDDRRAAGAGAAALARGDEHHVGALEHLFDLVAVLLGGLRPTSGSEPAPRPRVSSRPMSSFTSASLMQQRLRVGVDRDELDALQPGVDHAVDGVARRRRRRRRP